MNILRSLPVSINIFSKNAPSYPNPLEVGFQFLMFFSSRLKLNIYCYFNIPVLLLDFSSIFGLSKFYILAYTFHILEWNTHGWPCLLE